MSVHTDKGARYVNVRWFALSGECVRWRIHGIHIPNESLKLCMRRNTEYAESVNVERQTLLRENSQLGAGEAVCRDNVRINCGNYKVSSV